MTQADFMYQGKKKEEDIEDIVDNSIRQQEDYIKKSQKS